MKRLFLESALLLLFLLQGHSQVISDFEGGNVDGWVSEGDGVYLWQATDGNPGACFQVNDDATGDMNMAYAPVKFLGNWSAATGSDYLKADVYMINLSSGGYVTSNWVFRISGPGGQATAILNPYPTPGVWHTYEVPIAQASWQLNSGTWSGLVANVTTLIVMAEYINGDEYDRIDNVTLSFTPVVMPVTPVVCSGFSDGTYEGWTCTGQGSLSLPSTSGNPGYCMQVNNGSGTSLTFAPPKFLGDWNQLDDFAADIRFDLNVTINSGSTVLNDAFLRLTGPGGQARMPMTGVVENAYDKWFTFSYPVRSSDWTMVSGTWGDLLDNITELRLCLEFSSGSETVLFDNFCISNLPPIADFASDQACTFVGNPVQFTDRSVNAPTAWAWNFGDGGTSSQQDPGHTYTSAGTYSVSMTASNHFGSDAEVKSDYITVLGIDGCRKFSDTFTSSPVGPAWIIKDGTWSISSSTLMQSSNYYVAGSVLDGCYAVTGSLDWPDYYVSANLKTDDNDGIGLVYNLQDFQNMYMFYWRLETSERILYKWVNGVATVLASDNTPYSTNTWYNVRLGGYNGFITLTIDGTEIFGVVDNTFTRGKAGLYCWALQNGYWDNFLVECAVPDTRSIGDTSIGSGESACFDGKQVVITGGGGTSFAVLNGGSANLVAGQAVRMLPGTTAQTGGALHAWISSDGFYCNTPFDAPAIINGVEPPAEERPVRLAEDGSGIRLYPNPTPGMFTVELTGEGTGAGISVEVFSMLGERVIKMEAEGENAHRLDLSGRRDGIYLVRITRGDSVQVKKVILQQ